MNLETIIQGLRADVEQSLQSVPSGKQAPTYLLDTIAKLLLIEYLFNGSVTPPSVSNGDGGATRANQLTEIERLTEIRDRLPQNGTGGNANLARTTYQNLGNSSSEIVRGQSGSIFALTIYSTAVSTRWIQLYDSNQSITSGSIPTETYPVFAGSFLVLDSNYFGEGGLKFDEGITFAFSDVGGIYSPASENFEFHLKYI